MTKKVSYISLISVISCFAVVFLHSNGCFWAFSREPYWITANIIECLFYFAVPCFFMISGATLLNFREKYSLSEYFKKRSIKTFIPFIFWSLVGLAYLIVKKNISFSDLSVMFIYNGIMRTSFVGIYWFFITLFGMYLSIPLFAAVKEESRREIFTYLVCVGTVVNVLVPFIISLSGKDIAWPFSLTVLSGSLIYLPLGFLIRQYDMNRTVRILIYVSGVAGFLAHLLGTYYLSVHKGEIVNTFKGYNNLPCLLFSVAVFVFLKYNTEKILRWKLLEKAINLISGYTFSIYLMHWFLLDIFIRVTDVDTRSLLYRLGVPFIVIPVAIAVSWVLKKIPLLRRIVP